jgi:hypothetical protein
MVTNDLQSWNVELIGLRLPDYSAVCRERRRQLQAALGYELHLLERGGWRHNLGVSGGLTSGSSYDFRVQNVNHVRRGNASITTHTAP